MNVYTMSTIFNQTTNSFLSHGGMLMTCFQNSSRVLVSKSICSRSRPGISPRRAEGTGCCSSMWRQPSTILNQNQLREQQDVHSTLQWREGRNKSEVTLLEKSYSCYVRIRQEWWKVETDFLYLSFRQNRNLEHRYYTKALSSQVKRNCQCTTFPSRVPKFFP